MATPANAGWTCASWKPGSSARPRRLTTSVPGPVSSRRLAASRPRAAIRPPATATAPAGPPSGATALVIRRVVASAV